MSSFHFLDILAILGYLGAVMYIGYRASHGAGSEEGFFLAGRKLGKLYQFFLNFGNSTDANGAVSTASLVYQRGASGAWFSFQTIFMNPYYWFMNLWFRRVRLITVADLFEDRLGSRSLARFYAIFQILASVVVMVGFGNLIAYKISSSLIVKDEAVWTAEERASVEGYREMQTLERELRAGSLPAETQLRLTVLREQNARGELRSYITAIQPVPFYLAYTLIVGIYIVLGGMAAAALNEAFQGILIVIFSIMLIPVGVSAIGGWQALGEKVPDAMFQLFGGGGAAQVTGWELAGIVLISIVQIHGIIGNMAVAGSAKSEFAARFGAVSGTYAKRVMIILWAFAGLIALALYAGPEALSDPDAVWGTMSRELLGPGFLGLMLAGVLAANMSTVAAQTMAVSALFVRNVYRYINPGMTDRQSVTAGRWTIVVALVVGIIAATNMTGVFQVIQLLLTVNVPFGAAVVLIFFWRRLTSKAVWAAVLISAACNIVAPLLLSKFEAVRTHPDLVERTEDAFGRPSAVYFETVVRTRPDDLDSPLEGRGRFHTELYVLDKLGLDVAALSPSHRNAARFLFDGIFPFVLLIAVSLFTRPPEKERVLLFYGKMKTPVAETPELDAEEMEKTRRNPTRNDHRKLFPGSSWEFTKWDKVDTVGFLSCCAVSGAIIGLFLLALRLASGS
jgi:Na+/proline symporter